MYCIATSRIWKSNFWCVWEMFFHKANILFMLHKINYKWVLKDGAMMSVEPAVRFLQSNSLFDDETSAGISISFWTLSRDVVSLVIQKCYLRLCWPEVHLTLHSHPTSFNRNHWELWLRDCTCKQKISNQVCQLNLSSVITSWITSFMTRFYVHNSSHRLN